MKKLDNMTLNSFLAEPLTSNSIQQLHTNIRQAMARVRRYAWWLSALYVLTSIAVAYYFLETFTQISPIEFAKFSTVLALSLVFFDRMVTNKVGVITMLALFFPTIALCAGLLPETPQVVVFIVFLLLSIIPSVQYDNLHTEQAQLAPAAPDECSVASDAALEHPEVEQLRQDLLRNEREFLTVCEYKAILSFKDWCIEAEQAEKAHARCRQFLTADTL